MKKQFLILILFVAAIVAGTSNAFGQYLTVPDLDANGNIECIKATPILSCTGVDELHPVQGVEYTYTVATTTSPGDYVRWFVVNNKDLKDPAVGTPAQTDSLINSIGQVLAAGSDYIDPADGSGDYILSLGATNNTYDDITSTDNSIKITWKFFDGHRPEEVLLVAYVEAADHCTDNIAVYRIIPKPSFTLDIAVLNDNGDSIAGPLDPLVGECVSNIESATYQSIDDISPNGTLTVDYGENWAFFVVNAANFIDSWKPRFQISYAGARDSMMAQWTYANAATNTANSAWHSIDIGAGTSPDDVIAGGGNTDGTPINAAGDMEVSAAIGECIVIRVRIDYGTVAEHDNAASLLSVAVDGTMYDPSDGSYTIDNGFDDLHYGDCGDDGFTNDVVTYEITPRPEAEAGTPTPESKTGDETN